MNQEQRSSLIQESFESYKISKEDSQVNHESKTKKPMENKQISLMVEILSIVVGTLVGTILRINIVKLSYFLELTQSDGIIFKDFLTNIIGCFIVGLYIPLKAQFQQFAPSINLLVITGICGTITTWSAWMLILCQLMLQGFLLEAVFALFVGFATASAGYTLGVQTNSLFIQQVKKQKIVNNKISGIIYFTIAIGAYLFLLFAYFVLNWKSETNISLYLSLIVGPFGALLRWQLQTIYNAKSWLPLGTFFSNILGVTLGAIVLKIIENHGNVYLLMPIIDGFCGDLTTVSSWIHEQHTLSKLPQKWIYAILSFTFSIVIGVSILAI